MAKKATTVKESNSSNSKPEVPDGSIDQVRELLFGDQARRVEGRIEQLENRISELHDELDKRLQSFSHDASEESQGLRMQLRDFRHDSENRLAELENEWSSQLNDLSKSFTGDLKLAQQKLHTAHQTLDKDKLGRVQLAELLNNLAAQLVQEPE